MAHICEMKEEINELYHAIFGNGKPGLKTTVALLEQTTKENTEAMKDLRTAINGINKFMNQSIGKDTQKEMFKLNLKWAIGTIITLVGVIVSIKTGIL